MLVPLLDATADWITPPEALATLAATHFAQRAAERGVRSVSGARLMFLVIMAQARGRCDLMEPVYEIDETSTLYRVLLPEGPVYPVLRGSAVVTIYGAKEKRKMRTTRRMRKRQTGSRRRRSAS